MSLESDECQESVHSRRPENGEITWVTSRATQCKETKGGPAKVNLRNVQQTQK
jgi:hypothetical protein